MKTLAFITLIILAPSAIAETEGPVCVTVAEMTGIRMDAESAELTQDDISMPITIRLHPGTGDASVDGWDADECAAAHVADGITVFCISMNPISIATETWRLKEGVATMARARHSGGMFGSAHSIFAGAVQQCE